MQRSSSLKIALAFVALGVVVVLWSRGIGATSPAASAQVARRDNVDCWWSSTEKECFSAVWLGPRLEDPVEGGFRFVNVIFHDLSCADSSALWSSVARLDRRDPVAIGNGSIEFEVVPAHGMTWGEVEQKNDLAVALRRQP